MNSYHHTFRHLNHYNDGEFQTWSSCQNKMKTLSGRTSAFNSSFYPYSIKEWCALSEEIRNIVSVNEFHKISVLLDPKRTPFLQYITPKVSNY